MHVRSPSSADLRWDGPPSATRGEGHARRQAWKDIRKGSMHITHLSFDFPSSFTA